MLQWISFSFAPSLIFDSISALLQPVGMVGLEEQPNPTKQRTKCKMQIFEKVLPIISPAVLEVKLRPPIEFPTLGRKRIDQTPIL